jgi:hypothetical protein
MHNHPCYVLGWVSRIFTYGLRNLAEEKGVQCAKEASGYKSDRYIWRYVKPNQESLSEAVDALDAESVRHLSCEIARSRGDGILSQISQPLDSIWLWVAQPSRVKISSRPPIYTGKATTWGWPPMVRSLVFLLLVLLTCWTHVEAQEVIVNGVGLQHVYSNLKITIDIIEFRQDEEPIVHLTTGKKHYELALVSPAPIPVFDAELPLASPQPSQFTVTVEDTREFQGCLVKGLSSFGEPSRRQFSYALACEDLSRLSLPYPTGN